MSGLHVRLQTHLWWLSICIILTLGGSYNASLFAQASFPTLSASEVQHQLKHLRTLGSVLYIAAHPDDENTRLITYLAKGKGYRTGYLSLTRGDGGQNLIGDEKGEFLGVLRTQELLAARRIDGGEQMFSRAFDFGYSKTPEETLEIWDEEKVLADVVFAIRKFRPDVIITRFATPEKGGGGHGHHTSSAILAQRAFDMAGDATQFPEQLSYVAPWQPTRLLWNNYWVFRRYEPTEEELRGILTINAGAYDPLLGQNYGEIASLARSMHRCQAFGTRLLRGDIIEYLEHEKGTRAENDLFDDINSTWSRIKGGDVIDSILTQAYTAFSAEDPTLIVPLLTEAYTLMENLEDPWVEIKKRDLEKLIVYCSGLWMELNSVFPNVARGDSVSIDLSIIKRSTFPIQLRSVYLPEVNRLIELNDTLPAHGKPITHTLDISTESLPISQSYWLEAPRQKGIFQVDDQAVIGLPQNEPTVSGIISLIVGETEVQIPMPVIHKYVNRARGEIYQPFIVAPAVTVNLGEKVYVFADDNSQEITLKVRAFAQNTAGSLQIEVPEGWKVTPQTVDFSFDRPGAEQTQIISVTPPTYASQGTIKALVNINGEQQSYSYTLVDYEHIPAQSVFMPATAALVHIELNKRGEKIGYIVGSGDEVPKSLLQMGYQVDILTDDQITRENLAQYDAVVAGIRAYNRNKRLPFLQDEIFAYVKEGGTYVVQYNTTYDLSTRQPAPYPITLSRERVTKEDAEVTFLTPDHPVLNEPNKLSKADFTGWNQERGLYFPSAWDEAFVPILSWHDPGEEPKEGGLLVAEYGEGYMVYTGISFFRHLPAGVAGSYRLFANLVSLRQK